MDTTIDFCAYSPLTKVHCFPFNSDLQRIHFYHICPCPSRSPSEIRPQTQSDANILFYFNLFISLFKYLRNISRRAGALVYSHGKKKTVKLRYFMARHAFPNHCRDGTPIDQGRSRSNGPFHREARCAFASI